MIAICAGSLWLFIEVADEVTEGDAHAYDRQIILALRNAEDLSDPIGPEWIEESLRDLTALGGFTIITLITAASLGYLILRRKYRIALLLIVTVSGSLILSLALKSGFDRPRPDLVPHKSYVYTQSFPSGHSMLSAVTYLTLGALLARVQKKRLLKAYILILAILLAFLVGVSRVYLGVHWPTDVLAGWTAGAAWASMIWLITRWLQGRGHVESANDVQASITTGEISSLNSPELVEKDEH